MLSLFTTAKPFRGHSGIIQCNALKSWTLLDPDIEIILFGDDEGAAEVCAEYGLGHEPHLERHERGVKRVKRLIIEVRRLSDVARELNLREARYLTTSIGFSRHGVLPTMKTSINCLAPRTIVPFRQTQYFAAHEWSH